MAWLVEHLGPLTYTATILLGAAVAGFVIHLVLHRTVSRIARHTANITISSLVAHLRRPTRVLLPLVAVSLALPFVHLPQELRDAVDKILIILLICTAAWILIGLTSVFEDIVLRRYDMGDRDNLRARKIHTQIKIVRQILIVTIMIVTLAAILFTFQDFRRLGTGLLASAGVAGIVLGMAARPILSNLLAGIQLALTEPIRLDDVVVVEDEWGRIEEITLTYVVVKIWDLRRLVVPIGYFLEKPFRSWTRQSADLIASVYIYTDYTVPVAKVREELRTILQESKLWKGEVGILQVTDATERTVQLRAIMDAPDSGSAWNLRCEVREKLISFLQRECPGALPKVRAELAGVEAKL